jgi:hypothetical protein
MNGLGVWPSKPWQMLALPRYELKLKAFVKLLAT